MADTEAGIPATPPKPPSPAEIIAAKKAGGVAVGNAAAPKPARSKFASADLSERDADDRPRQPKTFSSEPGDFVFIGDPQDARRGPLMEIDDESGEETEPPLEIMGHSFPRKKGRNVKDGRVAQKLRGNSHFIEILPGQSLEEILAKLPKASREKRHNISVARLGVPTEGGNRKKLPRKDRDTAGFEDEV